MRRMPLLLLIALCFVLPALAQDADEQPPDYQIYALSTPTLEGNVFKVSFGIINIGGDSTAEATVILTVATTGEQLGIATVPPIPAQNVETVEFTFPANTFPPGSSQSLQASVGIGEVEPRGGPTISNNTVRIGLQIPPDLPPAEAEATETPADDAAGPGFTLPVLNRRVDLNNPLHAGMLLAVIGIVLVLIWVLTIILRLMFQKSPALGAWQPPYATLAVLDPDSTAGRRNLWQPHAQNDALLLPCAEGTYHIRKLLFGTDGAMLSGWRITALRLSQYDMYGRVARTHTLAASGLVKRLDRAAHKDDLDMERALKLVRPVARTLAARFEKRLSKKNAGLPVALDLRLRGTHGEARILFELFGCQRGEWHLIDSWEPEVIVVQGGIQENFTYTLFGQHPGEPYKDFRKRLETEIARTLAEMITRRRASSPQVPVPARATPSVEEFVPQDTSPHPPTGY